MSIIVGLILGGFALFLIISTAVKIGVKEALMELKEEEKEKLKKE